VLITSRKNCVENKTPIISCERFQYERKNLNSKNIHFDDFSKTPMIGITGSILIALMILK